MSQEGDPQVVQNSSEPIPKGGVNDWVIGGGNYGQRGVKWKEEAWNLTTGEEP